MPRWWRLCLFVCVSVIALRQGRIAEAGAEVRLGKDFLSGIVEKLPPVPFEKVGQYRGTVHSFRLVAIDPRTRQFLAVCQIEGEYHPPVSGPVSDRVARSPQTPPGWRRFRFDVRAKVNIEPSIDGTPRFRIAIDEVKRRELDGFAGVVAKFLGKFFDDMVTQIAEGRASRLNQRLNGEILKRVGIFKEYGVFSGIDYTPSDVVLHFDLTRLRSEGIVGHVFPEQKPGTVPLYRWLHPADGSHFYTTRNGVPDRLNSVGEGIACYIYNDPAPETVPIYHWANRRDHLYTTSPSGENAGRAGYWPEGIAFYVYPDPKPGTVPLYRFRDPIRHHHFYTTHPHAEFAK